MSRYVSGIALLIELPERVKAHFHNKSLGTTVRGKSPVSVQSKHLAVLFFLPSILYSVSCQLLDINSLSTSDILGNDIVVGYLIVGQAVY